ncbi:hypothetical protein [Sulfurovum mangrovi]|uniref:hypothetical protein n=1 Tax=Sulfurovum mangrovi TaxID=2893889 RepID=UPI001E43030B|nr:hypothetical protein [Sulfurovum mangrovi]UFH58061.1 hypothetical protein LN246_06825 [Sulfurovum mangrovi]
MKEIKPHEERYFKDIVLRSILKEISNEQGAKPLDDLIPSKTPMGRNKQIAWFFLASLSIVVLAAFFTPAAEKTDQPAPRGILTKQDTPHQTKKPKEMAKIREELPSKLKIETKEDALIIVSKHSAKACIEPMQQSERELAKAQLLKQMKN